MSIYLDNAATSFPKPEQVYEAMQSAMRLIGASPGRGAYRQSMEASRLLFSARETAAGFVGCSDSSRLLFTHSATESLNLALKGSLSKGDHLITSSMEHNSLLRPIKMLESAGVSCTIVEAGPDGLTNPAAIKNALLPNTKMIALAHVSNVTGTIQPIAEISAIAKAAGAMLLVDAAQSVGLIPINMETDGIDLLAAPGHKGLMGPQGTGFLAVAPNVPLRPLLAGGTGASSDREDQPDSFPEGFEAGTHNLPGIAGLKAGIEFIISVGADKIGLHERKLAESARQQLAEIPGLTLYGPTNPEQRTGVISCTVAGTDCSALAFALDHQFEIAVRAGLHCAPKAHRTIGTYPEGTLRISPGWFSTQEHIDACCKALTTLSRKGAS
jgi:cysteine desulfurase / selenocysteine lyase